MHTKANQKECQLSDWHQADIIAALKNVEQIYRHCQKKRLQP